MHYSSAFQAPLPPMLPIPQQMLVYCMYKDQVEELYTIYR